MSRIDFTFSLILSMKILLVTLSPTPHPSLSTKQNGFSTPAMTHTRLYSQKMSLTNQIPYPDRLLSKLCLTIVYHGIPVGSGEDIIIHLYEVFPGLKL